MKKIFTLLFALLAFSSFAQDSIQPAYAQALQDRQGLCDALNSAIIQNDTTVAGYKDLTLKMTALILADSAIIAGDLVRETARADSLSLQLAEASKEKSVPLGEQLKKNLYLQIALGVAVLFLILFVVMLVMMLGKTSKTVKIHKQLEEKEEQLSMMQDRLAKTETEEKEQIAELNKCLEEAKIQADQQARSFSSRESEYKSQVAVIEQRMKEAGKKESDLNYQVFQLELKLKNELESTLAQKCALENKVADLERELSEARLRLEENKPATVDVSGYEDRIHSLEQALSDTRQGLEEEKQQMTSRAEELQATIDRLQHELEEARTPTPEADGGNAVDSYEIQDLKAKIDWYANEADYFRDLIAKQNAEKEALLRDIEQLRQEAGNAHQQQERINELLRLIDQFRQV